MVRRAKISERQRISKYEILDDSTDVRLPSSSTFTNQRTYRTPMVLCTGRDVVVAAAAAAVAVTTLTMYRGRRSPPSSATPPRALSREEVRAVDEKAIALGLPGIVLMENAALGLTRVVVDELQRRGAALGAAVAIVAKTGNNGGDGFVVARQLTLLGYSARVAYCGDRSKAKRETDAGINLTVLERSGATIVDVPDASALAVALSRWADAVLVVDCLYGTGLAATMRPDGIALVEALNNCPLPKIACDLPSGLDCDTGLPLGAAVRAVRTVTFVGRKRGFDEPRSREYTGPIDVIPIGCPTQCWTHVV